MEAGYSTESSKTIPGWIGLMQQSLRECYQLTQQLVELSSISPEQLSEGQHEEITMLLNKREQLIPNLHKPATKEEKQAAAAIVEQSNELNRNLIEIKMHIQMKIKDLKKKQQSNKQYLGYNMAGANSYFYDKKR